MGPCRTFSVSPNIHDKSADSPEANVNGLNGSIPPLLGHLVEINRFSGMIPREINKCSVPPQFQH